MRNLVIVRCEICGEERVVDLRVFNGTVECCETNEIVMLDENEYTGEHAVAIVRHRIEELDLFEMFMMPELLLKQLTKRAELNGFMWEESIAATILEFFEDAIKEVIEYKDVMSE